MSKKRAATISNGLLKRGRKAAMTKKIGGEQLPAGAFLVVGDPAKVGTWHLPVKRASGKADRARMGAAWAALHGGYRGHKYQGEGKAQAIVKLKKLYSEVGASVPQTKAAPKLSARDRFIRSRNVPSKKELKASFKVVYKEGKYRWVAISSNAYEDREGEIVSEKALKTAVNRGDCGDLRWWHVANTSLGTCDFQMVKNKMLIESGTFKSKAIAKAVAAMGEMQMSIGFTHPPYRS